MGRTVLPEQGRPIWPLKLIRAVKTCGVAAHLDRIARLHLAVAICMLLEGRPAQQQQNCCEQAACRAAAHSVSAVAPCGARFVYYSGVVEPTTLLSPA